MPLQVFTIGDSLGIGIQGAVYRCQTTVYGDSLIFLTREISYVLNGTLSGRTSVSVILWVLGTVALTCTTIYAFIAIDDREKPFFSCVTRGVITACLIYLASSIVQYGFVLRSMAGSAIPVGIFLILFWVAVLNKFPDLFSFEK